MRNNWSDRWFFVFPLALLLVITTGCGKDRTLKPLSGKVTYNGQPLKFGVVMLQSESGQPSTGKIQPDGTFTLVTRGEGEGVPVGRNLVKINCFEGQSPEVLAKNPGALPGRALIPAKYVDYKTSGIVIDIKPGENEPFILNLTDR